MDQQQQAQLREQAPQTYVRVEQGQPLGTADVKALAKAGVSDDVIIAQIQNSHTVYHLSAADIIDLHNSGVSDKVINFMINTHGGFRRASATTVVVERRRRLRRRNVVVAAPDPATFGWAVNGCGRWLGLAGRLLGPSAVSARGLGSRQLVSRLARLVSFAGTLAEMSLI